MGWLQAICQMYHVSMYFLLYPLILGVCGWRIDRKLCVSRKRPSGHKRYVQIQYFSDSRHKKKKKKVLRDRSSFIMPNLKKKRKAQNEDFKVGRTMTVWDRGDSGLKVLIEKEDQGRQEEATSRQPHKHFFCYQKYENST